MSRILYTGAFRFPDRDAAAARVAAVASLWTTLGWDTTFAGLEQPQEGRTQYQHGPFMAYPQGEFRQTELGKLRRLFGFLLRGNKTFKWIQTQPRFDAIVLYNPPAIFAWRILRWGREQKIPIILDSTEWYESSHLPGGKFGIAALENWIRMRWAYPTFKNIICISKFLECHFNGRHVLRVPALMADQYRKEAPRTREDLRSPQGQLQFLYAGEAGRKDMLVPFIQALPIITEKTHRHAVLCVLGTDESEVESRLKEAGLSFKAFRTHLRCLGRVSPAQVANCYRQSHFSILFRNAQRYALAGFPTKAVESLAAGCPLILNRVGDIGEMVENQREALIVDTSEISTKLPILLSDVLKEGRFSTMESAARGMALRQFEPKGWVQPMAKFLANLKI
jgi:glycosyltransferase involved in cell wall biosynthesis